MLDPYTPPSWASHQYNEYIKYNSGHNTSENSEHSECLLNNRFRNTMMGEFLSPKNLQVIQQLIIEEVYNKSDGKFRIHPQDPVALMTVMTEIYDLNRFTCKERFNYYVANHASTNIIENILNYIHYTSKLNPVSLRMDDWKNVMELPKFQNQSERDTLEYKQPAAPQGTYKL